MSEYNNALRDRLSDFWTVTRHLENDALAAPEHEREVPLVSGGYGGMIVRGTSPDGRQVVVVGTEPTAASKRFISHAVGPLAGVVARVIMGVTPWRRGTESGARWLRDPLYEQAALYTWRLSISEARRRSRQVQLNADRRRLEFFARDAERELDRDAWYDL